MNLLLIYWLSDEFVINILVNDEFVINILAKLSDEFVIY